MKTKILTLLLVIPTVILTVYYTIGAQLFEDDKIAYIYSHAQEGSVTVKKEMREYFSDLSNFFTVLVNTNQYPVEYFEFFSAKYQLKGIKLYDVTKQKDLLISFGDEHRSLNFTKFKNNEIKFRPQGDGSALFVYGQLKEARGRTYFLSIEMLRPSFVSSMSDSSFNTALFDSKGKTIAQFHKEKEDSTFASGELNKIFTLSNKNRKVGVQTRTIDLEGKVYLATFVPINIFEQSYNYVSLYPREKALIAMRYFKAKTLMMALLVLSLSGILGVIISNVLTHSLNELKVAAQELSNENFDQEINIKSSDEVGMLAKTFDTMRVNIRDLLEKIREYNLSLEDMVAQRTAELNEALALQKTMVDNLDEGFFMFKEGAELLPVYTEASKSMLPGIGVKTNFVDICGVDEMERESLIEFCDLMISGDLPFKDVAELAPQEFVNPEERHIHFNYAPVVGEDGKNKYIVVSAKDKTEEIKAMEQARKEKEFVDGMITFLQKKKKFFFFISEYKKQRDYYLSLEETDMEQMRVFVHTLKGNAGIYHLTELVDYLHQWEEDHKYNESDEVLNRGRIREIFNECTSRFNNEISQYEMILELSDIDEIKQTVELNLSEIEDFREDKVIPLRRKKFTQSFDHQFTYETVGELLPNFKDEAKRIASKLGKQIYDLELVGLDVKIPRDFKNIVDNLVHMLRNAMDHAIEMPDTRKEAGKDPKGSIGMFFKDLGGWLEIRVVDDGGGINFEKIIEIYTANNGPMPESMVKEDLLFLDGLSSREEASEISGRGVGMGALKEAIEARGGNIQIFTKLQQGTTFILRLPFYEVKQEEPRLQEAA
jgi:two-component system chemotaxis sensor kinase CheA